MNETEPWETVNHFKVNKWMLRLGAEWTVSQKRVELGITGLGDQWELDGMVVSQEEASKWYAATHKRNWRRIWM